MVLKIFLVSLHLTLRERYLTKPFVHFPLPKIKSLRCLMSRNTAKLAHQARFSSGHIAYTTEIADFLGQIFEKEESRIVRGYKIIRDFQAIGGLRKISANPILGEGTPTPREVRIANKKRRGRDANNIFLMNDIDEIISCEGSSKNMPKPGSVSGHASDRSCLSQCASARSVQSYRSISSNDSNISSSDITALEELKHSLQGRLDNVNKRITQKIQDARFTGSNAQQNHCSRRPTSSKSELL